MESKKLAVGPSKSDEDEKWSIGFAAVDLHGRPLPDKSKRGGWKASMFIFGNEIAERMAFFGIAVNFITYLVYKYHETFPDAATLITNVLGTSCLTPLLGAFIADAYIGRYWTIAIFSMIYFLGLVIITVSAIVPQLRPLDQGCSELKLYLGLCEKATSTQLTFLYIGLYIVAIGSGGIRPCVSAFGADQFDVEDPAESKNLGAFFNLFYFMITIGIAVSLTAVVYIQDYVGWDWGIGVLAISMAVAIAIFVAGTRMYRHRLPSGSPLTRLSQVVAAAIRKKDLQMPADSVTLYEVQDKESAILGSRKLKHTDHYRFLDRAAIRLDEEDENTSAWRLCTVTQVEELKLLLRFMPIWCTGILLNTVFFQLLNFSVQQGLIMDRRLGNVLTIPAASIPVFAAIFILVILPLYDRVFVPAARSITKNPRGITFLQRVGIGMVLSMIAVIIAALVERKRRALAYENNIANNPIAVVPMSAFWLVIQYSLAGLAEVFASIGLLEFFYDQAPDSMRSIGASFFSTATAAGSYFASLLVTIVKRSTKGSSHGSWLANNINIGHVDYYYWLLAGLSAFNLVIFLVVSHRYEYKEEDKPEKQISKQDDDPNATFELVKLV